MHPPNIKLNHTYHSKSYHLYYHFVRLTNFRTVQFLSNQDQRSRTNNILFLKMSAVLHIMSSDQWYSVWKQETLLQQGSTVTYQNHLNINDEFWGLTNILHYEKKRPQLFTTCLFQVHTWYWCHKYLQKPWMYGSLRRKFLTISPEDLNLL